MKTINLQMNLKRKVLILCSGIMTLGFLSCSDDDNGPDVIIQEEVITTMNVTLTATGSTITLQTQDLDGDGPNEPVINISGDLLPNTTYAGSIELLNETENPAEDITEEVEELDKEHQFFFATTGAISGFDYSDSDGDGNPLGLSFTVSTGDAGNGTLQITLRHEPKKPNDGTLADAGGETDITQTFNVSVQ